MKFNAVAFDLDGTLYPNYRFYLRLIPFLLREQRLLRAMGRARNRMRDSRGNKADDLEIVEGDFYKTQAALMAAFLGESPENVIEKTERLIYRGWEPLFIGLKLFPHVIETLDALRESGIKTGLLSDFPPQKKLENLKIEKYWDAVLCSELTGRLKPDPASFLELARKLNTAPEDTLYVGNSVSYDVKGASGAGMKTALVLSRWKKRPKEIEPDFVFYDYRRLRDYVLR